MIEKLLAGGMALAASVAVAVASLGAVARMSMVAHSWANCILAAAR